MFGLTQILAGRTHNTPAEDAHGRHKNQQSASRLKRAVDNYIAELLDFPESVGRYPMHDKS